MTLLRRLLPIAALAAVMLFPAVTRAEATLDRIKASGTISLGYREASVPFSYVGNDREPWGYSVELCSKVAASIRKELKLADLKIRWVPVTSGNRISKLKAREIDLECGSTTATLSRMKEVDFSLIVFADGGSYMTRADSGIKNFGDLGGKKLAVATGTTTQKTITEALKRGNVAAEVVLVEDHDDGVAALAQGKVDAYASDRALLVGIALGSGNSSAFKLASEFFSYEPYALMLRRDDQDFRVAVNRELARLFRSGEILAIYERWFGAVAKPGPTLESLYFLNGLPE
jgi:ABC-type amino acid transport substrate-binding protein